jgi:hypothetical protein
VPNPPCPSHFLAETSLDNFSATCDLMEAASWLDPSNKAE